MHTTEHLAVCLVGRAALAPCRNVVGIHFLIAPNAGSIRLVHVRVAVRAVRYAPSFRIVSLFLVLRFLYTFLKETNVQQAVCLAASKDIFTDARLVIHAVIGQEPLECFVNLSRIIVVILVFPIKPAPLTAFHAFVGRRESTAYPIDDSIEVAFHLLDVDIIAVLAHIFLNVSVAHPVEHTFHDLLTFDVAIDVGCPNLATAVSAIAEHFPAFRDERPGEDGIQHFLIGKRFPSNVDGLEPFLDFALLSFADVYQQGGF